MGKIEKGILGGFSGKVGPVVGANWRGIDVMRSRPKKSGKPATEPQLVTRSKFSLVTQFLAPIKGLLSKYFGQPAGEKSRVNLATSYHIKDAVTGVLPNFEIDFQKVIITKGELPGLDDAATEIKPNAVLGISWVNNSGQGQAQATDLVLLVAFNTTKNLFDFSQQATRSATDYDYNLPDSWSGDTVHLWVAVTSDEREMCSVSSYLGEFVLL